jgi:histidinol phosphatase-like enzyme (inositol monophosphatase family)
LNSSELIDFVEFGNELVDVAGAVIKRYFRQKVDIEIKSDASPVTVADRKAEQAIRERICERWPEHAIFGEEFGRDGDSMQHTYTWVIDPIDGTKSFIHGVPTFGTLIALVEDGIPVLGIIDAPALAERWVGVRGRPTLYNGESCQTRPCKQLTQASLYCTSIDMFKGEALQRFDELSKSAAMRRFGGDCYAYGLLAMGFIDLVVEAQMAPYDYMALAPVVENAGGIISDWQGNPLTLDAANDTGTVLAAATPELHAQALQFLSL